MQTQGEPLGFQTLLCHAPPGPRHCQIVILSILPRLFIKGHAACLKGRVLFKPL